MPSTRRGDACANRSRKRHCARRGAGPGWSSAVSLKCLRHNGSNTDRTIQAQGDIARIAGGRRGPYLPVRCGGTVARWPPKQDNDRVEYPRGEIEIIAPGQEPRAARRRKRDFEGGSAQRTYTFQTRLSGFLGLVTAVLIASALFVFVAGFLAVVVTHRRRRRRRLRPAQQAPAMARQVKRGEPESMFRVEHHGCSAAGHGGAPSCAIAGALAILPPLALPSPRRRAPRAASRAPSSAASPVMWSGTRSPARRRAASWAATTPARKSRAEQDHALHVRERGLLARPAVAAHAIGRLSDVDGRVAGRIERLQQSAKAKGSPSVLSLLLTRNRGVRPRRVHGRRLGQTSRRVP